ncbi:MAG: hypothetical protein U0271_36940 [Polyangiaceae bacterium]
MAATVGDDEWAGLRVVDAARGEIVWGTNFVDEHARRRGRVVTVE